MDDEQKNMLLNFFPSEILFTIIVKSNRLLLFNENLPYSNREFMKDFKLKISKNFDIPVEEFEESLESIFNYSKRIYFDRIKN